MSYPITTTTGSTQSHYRWSSLPSSIDRHSQAEEESEAHKVAHPTNTRLWCFQRIVFPDILDRPFLVTVMQELDYILLAERTLNIYGYGKTIEDARHMLKQDLLTLKQDWEEALFNASNTEPSEYLRLKELFGHSA